MSGSASRSARWALLEAVLQRYPHDDPPSLPEGELPRYAVVQRFFQKDVNDQADLDTFWYDFGDEPQEAVTEARQDRDQSGFEPFQVVDLDTGRTQAVASGVVIDLDPDGPPTYKPLLPDAAPLGPRGRLSPLADPADPPGGRDPRQPEIER